MAAERLLDFLASLPRRGGERVATSPTTAAGPCGVARAFACADPAGRRPAGARSACARVLDQPESARDRRVTSLRDVPRRPRPPRAPAPRDPGARAISQVRAAHVRRASLLGVDRARHRRTTPHAPPLRSYLTVAGEAAGIAAPAPRATAAHLQTLLAETQRQAEELQAQQEELRVNNEELEEQSRALKRIAGAARDAAGASSNRSTSQLEEQTQTLERSRTTGSSHDSRSTEQGGRARAREPVQERVPGQHEPRAAHAAQLVADPRRSCSPTTRTATSPPEQVQFAQTIYSAGQRPARAHQRHPRPLEDRGRARSTCRPSRSRSPRASMLADAGFQPIAAQKGLGFRPSRRPGHAGARSRPIRSGSGRSCGTCCRTRSSSPSAGEVVLRVYAAATAWHLFAVRDTGHRHPGAAAGRDLRGVPAGRRQHAPQVRRHRARPVDLARPGAPAGRRHHRREQRRPGQRLHADAAGRLHERRRGARYARPRRDAPVPQPHRAGRRPLGAVPPSPPAAAPAAGRRPRPPRSQDARARSSSSRTTCACAHPRATVAHELGFHCVVIAPGGRRASRRRQRTARARSCST